MTSREIETRIRKNYAIRNRRLAAALQNQARPTEAPTRSVGEKCAICRRKERGGGLLIYRLRDGQELALGRLCALYLNYLASHPQAAAGHGFLQR
jgi:hypothetical protein